MKTHLTSYNLSIIREIHENANSINEEELNELILEEFDCPSLEEELIEKGVCPRCQEQLESKSCQGDSIESWGTTYKNQLNKWFCPCCQKSY